ncbi:bifunctional diguanylate cyclase/phosphodiesterase [Paraglaciecola sp. L3A3]|uniref:sensor domain-containing protein n=1 Tax=Paraglaciecola sp. L3A3 TaxID=2686358 RepID=UPI00131E08B3|nr:sensor domain-containing diguanylate cyclase [Paraglaciecola sp. L3A3]
MKIEQFLHLEDVLELILDTVCVVDKTNKLVFVSAAFESMFGYKPEEVIGRSVYDFVYSEDNHKTSNIVEKILHGQTQPSFENRWVHKSGKIIHVLWSARWSEQHQVRIAVAHDITERKKMEQHLEYLANHDPLTKLPNRAALKKCLQVSLSTAKANNTHLYLLFIDLDNFKQINDNHNHTVGDQVLEIVAQRLLNCVRDTDIVGRLGGDEFVILLDNMSSKEDVTKLANKMCLAVEQPVSLANTTLQLSLSIGIAAYPEHGANYDSLMQFADEAMYKAKKAGGNRVIVF